MIRENLMCNVPTYLGTVWRLVSVPLNSKLKLKSLWPLLRIDYILCPKTYEVVSHEIPRVGLSDHYPVVAEITF